MRLAFVLSGALALAACDFGSAPVEQADNGMAKVDDPGVEASGKAVSSYGNGVVTLESTGSVEVSMARLQSALEGEGFTVIAMIDHKENASGVDLSLEPSQVVFFGKPEVGTFLMQEAPEAALDLPQRMAIYEDKEGRVIIAYNDPVWLASRHDVTGQDDRLKQISAALEKLAHAAAGTEKPVQNKKKKKN